MKIAIIGGHFTTALAVIEALPKNTEVIFIGRKYTFEGDNAESLEYKTIIKMGIPFHSLTTGRMQRTFSRRTLLSLAKLPTGYLQAKKILKNEKPDIVVGFGGYLSLPVGYAAHRLKIPLLIHEQTLGIGLANKLLSRFAKIVCISWNESAKFFPKNKTILTGLPIRKSIMHPSSDFTIKHSENLPLLYITGGSSGAHAINDIVFAALDQLVDRFTVLHQTGDAKIYNDFDQAIILKNSLAQTVKERYHPIKFIPPEDVGSIFHQATIIVGRSGINTIAEVLYFGKPSIFIPLPFAQKNEQFMNASLVKNAGLAEIIDQKDLTPSLLVATLVAMKQNLSSYISHKEEAKNLVPQDAAEKIAQQIVSIVQ